MERNPVKVLVYDLSQGLAKQMSLMLIGKQIDAIYHTSILVHGEEYFYSGEGIQAIEPVVFFIQFLLDIV